MSGSSREVAITRIDLGDVKRWRSGKVREVFDLGDELLIVATDRISAFDVVLERGIPGKGRVLTELSRHWFKLLDDVVPNHCISTEVADFPAQLKPYSELLESRSMLCVKTQPLPIECVVRGYVIGSGWKDYKATGSICGIRLPEGLEMASRLDEAIFTPSTKAESGHDENISMDEAA